MTWRDHLKVHPAADLFPLMSPDELRALGEDIKKNGLRTKIAVIVGDDGEPYLIDGRNRLDAMELVGPAVNLFEGGERVCTRDPDGPAHDPYAYVISANIHRRHLTAEQRRDLIAKLLKATPEKSNREIARQVKASHPTIAKVRREEEATGNVLPVEKTVGKDGKARKQPAKRRRTEDDRAVAFPTRVMVNTGDGGMRPATPEEEATTFAVADAIMAEHRCEAEAAPPEEIKANVFDTIERQKAVARAYKKVFAIAELDQASKDEVSDAIGTLITTWQSVQRRLAPKPAEQHDGIPPFLRRTAVETPK